MHLDALERGEHIVFLHQVQDGPADRSYGLQVAALAGVPKAVIQQAKQRLRLLERHMLRHELPKAVATTPQRGLFAVEQHPVLTALARMDVDALSPKQALAELQRLQDLLQA